MIQWRSTARSVTFAFLETFAAARPTELRNVYRKRPAAFGALPCAFILRIAEPRIEHSGYGIRQRDVSVQVAFVDSIDDNEAVADRLDALADAFIDQLSATPHLFSGNTEQSPRLSDEAELDLGGVTYAAVIVTLLGRIEENKL